MISSAERWLNSLGLTLAEEDFGREDEPEVLGCALANELGGLYEFELMIRPGLPEGHRRMFAEWAKAGIKRFAEHGPEPDGWRRRSDGAWQLWARRVQLPPAE